MRTLTKTLLTLAIGIMRAGSSVGLSAATTSGASSKASAPQELKGCKIYVCSASRTRFT